MIAFPKPKDQRRPRKIAVVTYPDGREVCQLDTLKGREEYSRRLDEMWERQKGICGLQISRYCKKFIPRLHATFEHTEGRGMNGAHRDDRVWLQGVPINLMACPWCNGEKSSRRLSLLKSN